MTGGGGRLVRGLRAGLTAGLAVGAVLGLVACLLVTLPPGVLRPVQQGWTLAAWAFSSALSLGLLGGLVAGLIASRFGDPGPVAFGLTLAGAALAPVAVVLNVRHLPALLSRESLLGNAALAALGLVLAALAAVVGARFAPRRRRATPAGADGPGGPPGRWLAVALAAGLLPGVVATRYAPPGESAHRWPEAPAGPGPATVLLVTIDALRADHLGCYGYPRATSPRIDRLAAGGQRFEAAYAAAPNTHPSLAALLTGAPLSAFDARAVLGFVPAGTDTLAAAFRRRGYRTAAVVSNPWLKAAMGFAQGFDDFDDRSAMGRDAREVTRVALELAGRSRAPLFLWVHYLDPHHPYNPPAPADRLFSPPDAEVDRLQARSDLADLLRAAASGEQPLGPGAWQRLIDLYDGEIRHADDALGTLLDGLDALGRLADSRVVVTADHGEEFRDHGGALHAHSLEQELVRVPLVLWSSTSAPDSSSLDPRLFALPQLGDLLLGGGRVPSEEVLSEKLHEGPDGRPALVSVRAPEGTLIVPSLRPPRASLSPARWARFLADLALFAPHALEARVYAADDPAGRHELGTGCSAYAPLARRLRQRYRGTVLSAPPAAPPDAETLDQLRGLGYVQP